MKTEFIKISRGLWPVIILTLAVAYLFQVAPHGHVDDSHADSHPTHHAHANHAHPPANGADERDSSGTEHHHHSVAQHLDFHSVRLCLRVVAQDHGNPAAPTEAVEPIHNPIQSDFVAIEPTELAPDDPLLLHAPSRAPPA